MRYYIRAWKRACVSMYARTLVCVCFVLFGVQNIHPITRHPVLDFIATKIKALQKSCKQTKYFTIRLFIEKEKDNMNHPSIELK